MNTHKKTYKEHTLELLLKKEDKKVLFTSLPDFLKNVIVDNIAIIDINGKKTITDRVSLDVQSTDVGNCYLRLLHKNSTIQEGYINGYASYPNSGNHFINRGVSVHSQIDKNSCSVELSADTIAILSANPTVSYSLLVRIGYFE